MSDRPRPEIAGFSLVELVFTLVIFGILISLAAPSMRGWIRKTKTTELVNQFTADVYYARMLAVRAGRRVEVRFTPSAQNACVQRYEIVVMTAPQRQAKVVDVNEVVRGACLNQSENSALELNSRGLLVPPARTVRASFGSVADSVRISEGGRLYRFN
jgi:prepilin-type N-terminal cleavage/methylation domain-containing protein